MPRTEDLSLAFIEGHPADAARVLERIAPQNVASLLSGLPSRLSAPLLRAMLPLHAARCLEPMDDDMISGVLRAMGPQAGVAILHYVPESRRNMLLTQLPTALALAFRLLLGYPEDTVGAWMDPRVLVLPPDMTAESALNRLREAEDETDSLVFVIESDQRLLGQIELPVLLRAAADLPLSRIMRRPPHTLPARAPIRAVEKHVGWDDFQILAVVEREDRFVGVLDRGVLARAVARTQQVRPDRGYGDLAATVASGYWMGVSSLIQLGVALLPATKPLANGGSHES